LAQGGLLRSKSRILADFVPSRGRICCAAANKAPCQP